MIGLVDNPVTVVDKVDNVLRLVVVVTRYCVTCTFHLFSTLIPLWSFAWAQLYFLSLQETIRPFPKNLPSHVPGIGLCSQDWRCKGLACTYAHNYQEQCCWNRQLKENSRKRYMISPQEGKKAKLGEPSDNAASEWGYMTSLFTPYLWCSMYNAWSVAMWLVLSFHSSFVCPYVQLQLLKTSMSQTHPTQQWTQEWKQPTKGQTKSQVSVYFEIKYYCYHYACMQHSRVLSVHIRESGSTPYVGQSALTNTNLEPTFLSLF